VFRREYLVSFRLVESKIKSIFSTKRQAYIDEICKQINILFNKSFRHVVKDHYKDFTWPYQSLIRNLKYEFESLFFNVDFSYSEEKDLMLIETREFLRKLLSLQIDNRYGEPVSLCNKEIKVKDIGYFIAGDMAAIPEIYFAWQVQSLYYLLIKLLDNKASFFAAGLEASGKIHLSNGKLFSQKGFNKYRSKLKNGKIQRKKEYELIDMLFR
jgi:hypothetical protein